MLCFGKHHRFLLMIIFDITGRQPSKIYTNTTNIYLEITKTVLEVNKLKVCLKS